MMADFTASEAPTFTLYGDGTVIYRDPFEAPPAPAAGSSLIPGVPFKKAKLSEEQVQAILEMALTEGGLGIARPRYDNPMVADAGTTKFEIHAGGVDKVVEVYFLAPDDPSAPDAAARKAFSALYDRLATFGQGGSVPSELYVPSAYRGALLDGTGAAVPDARPWPWPSIQPSDFVIPADPDVPSFQTRTLTPEELAPLGLPDVSGGAQGIFLTGPGDGKLYNLVLRPLLPGDPV